jgi:hypothetical protein
MEEDTLTQLEIYNTVLGDKVLLALYDLWRFLYIIGVMEIVNSGSGTLHLIGVPRIRRNTR